MRLATHPVEEVRNTDAWVMGQDATSKEASSAGFHEALLKMLTDPSLTVRGNAALSLVRFGDATGRPQILELLQSAKVSAPQSGKSNRHQLRRHYDPSGPESFAKLEDAGQTVDVRSPITGRLRTLFVQTGQALSAGTQIATIDPSTEQLWEALRALYLVGQPGDLVAITPYERNLPEIPDHIRQQATETEKAIRTRTK